MGFGKSKTVIKQSELIYSKDLQDADELTEEQLRRKYPFSYGQVSAKGTGIEGAKEGLTQAVDLATDVAPFIGTAKAATELPEDARFAKQLIEEGYDEGSIKKMGLGAGYGALTAAGFLPGAKVAADVAKKGIKEGVEDLGSQTVRAFADALEIGVNPATKDGALLKGYDINTSKNMAKNTSAATAGTKEANKIINAEVADGTQVGIRLNLNSTIPNMPRGLDKLQTLHQKNYNGKALSYRPFATVENVTFNVNQKGRQGIAAKIKGVDVPEAKSKFPAMSVDGQLNNTRNILNEMDNDVVEIGFNPMSGHLFVDMSTGQAVQSAEVATVVGDRVYAKGVTYMKKAEAPDPLSASDGTPLPSEVRYKMKKGGVINKGLMAKR